MSMSKLYKITHIPNSFPFVKVEAIKELVTIGKTVTIISIGDEPWKPDINSSWINFSELEIIMKFISVKNKKIIILSQ